MPALLVDTYSLFFRSFYGLPPMNTAAGLPTNALYGFSSLLLKLLREERPEAGAFALDLPTPSFRHALAPTYKAGRPATPSPLRQQLELLPELLHAFGFAQHAAPGFEADDVLASLADRLSASEQPPASAPAAENRAAHVLIASGDRDLLQLVNDHVNVLFLGRRGKPAQRYSPREVEERFGVCAARLPAYVALVGDSSDNLPKVPGIGEVTASRLIAAHADIETLLAHLGELTDARLRASLLEHAAQMRSSERLARLRRDVPLQGPLTAAFDQAAAERVRALFERLEFKSLVARLTPWLEP